MMSRWITTISAVCFAILLAASGRAFAADAPAPAAGEKIDLRLRYVAGSYELTHEMTMAQTIAMAGQQQVQNIESIVAMAMDVGKPDAKGQRKIQIQFKRIKQHMRMGPMQMAFDSAGPAEENPEFLAKAFQPLLGAKVTAILDANDQVIEVKGLDEIWQKTAAASPAMAALVNMMKGQMGDQFVKQMLTFSAKQFPGRPVGIGDTWKVEDSLLLPVLGKAKVQQDCTLTAIEQTPAGAVAIVSIIGKINMDKGTPMKAGGVTMTFTKTDLGQKIRSRMHVANAMLSEKTVERAGTIAATITMPDGQSQNITIQQKATIKTTARQVTPPDADSGGT